MTGGAAFLADRLRWVFRRHGAPGRHTDEFDRLPGQAQQAVLEQARLRPGEIAVIACVLDVTEWAVVTSEQLIWSRSGVVDAVEHRDIEAATVNVPTLRGPDSTELVVTTRTGELRLAIESGAPFFGFLNVVRAVVSGPGARS